MNDCSKSLAIRVAAFLLTCVGMQPCRGVDFTWTGPSTVRIPSGDWSDANNWSPRLGFPNSLRDAATIAIERGDEYEVRVDRDMQVNSLTLDSPAARLQPGRISPSQGRSIEFAPGGTLSLLRGTVEDDLRFLIRSGHVVIGDEATSIGLLGAEPRVEVQGQSNTLTATSAQLSSLSPGIVLRADGADAELTFKSTSSTDTEFLLLSGSQMALDAARGHTTTLTTDNSLQVVGSGLIGVGQALPHQGNNVLAFRLTLTAEGMLDISSPTTLGVRSSLFPMVHRNGGRIVVRDETLAIAPNNLFANGEEGVIEGTGTISSPTTITNFGRIHPDVRILGSLMNEATAQTSIMIGGFGPGVAHDQINVSEELTLGGTLQVQLADAFMPQPGDLFQIISAGSVTGRFDRFLPPALPDDRAFALLQTSTGVALGVREPVPFAVSTADPVTPFSAAFGGALPQSDWKVTLGNVAGTPQEIRVTEDQTVHSIQVAGGTAPSQSTTLTISQGALLAASSSLHVGKNASLWVEEGATVHAAAVEIDEGNFAGNGTLVGNLLNQGHVSPAQLGSTESPVGVLTIDGDFIQDEGGVLEIDVLGNGSTGHDMLNVTGSISLGGRLVLDVLEYVPFQPTGFPIASAGKPFEVPDEDACDVIGEGSCKVKPGMSNSINVFHFLAGDFDQDGDIDRDDLAIWQDHVGTMGPAPPPPVSGDADNDGDVDGDDLLAILLNFGQGTMPLPTASVPEPNGALILLVSTPLVALVMRRRGCLSIP